MKKLILAAALAVTTTQAAAWELHHTDDGGAYVGQVASNFYNVYLTIYAYPSSGCEPLIGANTFLESADNTFDWTAAEDYDLRIDRNEIWTFDAAQLNMDKLSTPVRQNGERFPYRQTTLMGNMSGGLEDEVRFGKKLIVRQKGGDTARYDLTGSNAALNRLSNACFDLQRKEADAENEWGITGSSSDNYGWES